MRLDAILAVARYEIYREFNKRSIWVIIILLLMPLIVALVVRGIQEEAIGRDPLMWAVIMGVDVERVLTLGPGTLTGAISVISWSWLIAILYGGDLFAADLQDGSIQMILSRPVKRSEYVAGKFLATLATMVGVFLIAGIGIIIAAWILAGPQERIGEALLLSSLVGVGVMPLLALSALIGLKTGKPVLGMVLGLLAWFIGQLVMGGLSVYYLFQENYEMAFKVSIIVAALFPFFGGDNLSTMVYARLHDIVTVMPITTPNQELVEVTIDYSEYLVHGVVALIAWIIALAALAWWILSRKDL